MTVTIVGATTNYSSAGSSTPTSQVPAGAVAGDTLFALLSSNGSDNTVTITPPDGWTEIEAGPLQTAGRWSLVTRTMAAGVTQAQWNLPASSLPKSECAMIAVRGASGYTLGTPYVRSASSLTTPLPGVTVPSGGLGLAFAVERTSTQTSVTAPTGMTEQAKYVQSAGGGGSVLIASTATAGATGTETVTYGVASTNAAGVMLFLTAAVGSLPQMSAGPDVTKALGSVVNLTGSAVGADTVAWTQSDGPDYPTISSPTSTTASVTPTVAGVYTFRLTGTNTNGSSYDEMQVTVTTTTAKPNGVVVNPGGFTIAGGADSLEDAASDGLDTTWDESGAANASITYQLPPMAPSPGLTLTWRGLFSTTPVVSVRLEVLSGSTVVSTHDISPTTSIATSSLTLTSGEVAAITDWNALALRVSKLG